VTPDDSGAVRQEYDRLAGEYDERWQRYVDETLRAVTDAITFRGGEQVLDIACGTGELERRLLQRWPGLLLIGCDLSAGMLAQAESKPIAGDVSWIQVDATALPFPDASFDAVICANSFHYFRAPEQSLAEMRRVLRPGARLVLVDWCDDYLSCRACSIWLRWTDPAFYRTYSLAAFRSLVESSGFEVHDAQRFRVGLIWGMMRVTGFRR
jgi:ubiquinone/menaquinone biosynthesis C-methylase UbiE